MDKPKKYVIIGDDDAKAEFHAKVLRAAGMEVVRIGRWVGRKGQILFVRRSDTGEEWSLSRFSLDAEVVAVGGWHEMTAMLPSEASTTGATRFDVSFEPVVREERAFGQGFFPPSPRAEVVSATGQEGLTEPISDLCDPRYNDVLLENGEFVPDSRSRGDQVGCD